MAAIKRFFEKRKLDIKFKQAGRGHSVADDKKQNAPSTSFFGSKEPKVTQHVQSSSQQRAAEAALTRMTATSSKGPALGTSAASIKLQAKKELEEEKNKIAQAEREAKAYAQPRVVRMDSTPSLAVVGVYYKCVLSGDQLLPKKEMEEFITNFLFSQLPEEPMMTSALIIHTLNKDPEKCRVCMDILSKYIDNIVEHPTEEKFRKIRCNNKAFKEKVASLKGTQEFLQAAGFEFKIMEGPNEVEEQFMVMDEEHAKNVEHLTSLKEILLCAEPIKPELDNNIKVYYPSPHAQAMELPPEFFTMTADELRKEQQMKLDAAEKLGMLRTKDMRERERIKELRRYRYCLIRVRFPNGLLLQGTFKAHDKFPVIAEFVRQCLAIDWIPFNLLTSTGQKLTEETQTLAELGLAPATVLNFKLDEQIIAEMAAQQGSVQMNDYLLPELLQNIKTL